ncbi:radical SAM protein [Halostella sp. PRR32]|uniref:SPL family radical SAM protein n=1 Tax=Halostella sp. PRR32 TaxID=3098147 RepID=UPI002B1E4CBF|nr:radical SAM protein [Halostella sp. PRR32]
MELAEVGAGPLQKFALRDSSGQFRTTFSEQPNLNELREASQEYGDPLERINILDAGLVCSNCNTSLGDRFGANSDSDLLCWDCAMGQEAETDQRGVSQTTDPTKAVLSESALYHKNLCNYVINVATGCTHGCKFCYVPSTPNIKMRGEMLENQANVESGQREWGSYLLYRDDMPERLARILDRKQKWKKEQGGRGVVMISSGTDCYQDRRAAQITRGCVIELVKHNRPVRILTRSPAVVRDKDIFKAADGLVTVGSSIPCLDDEMVRSIEPGAPAPTTRLNALQELSDAGVPVYVSMSPTYPIQDKEEIRNLMEEFVSLDPDVIFHEPINPRGQNFDMTVRAAREAGQEELADELEKLKDRDHWVEYSLNQLEWVEEIGDELDLPIHLWPDKQLIKYLDGEKSEELRAQLETTTSPEDYPSPKRSA